MIYKINSIGELVIRNHSDKIIFAMNKDNKWYKSDRDHNGKEVYYEHSNRTLIYYE